MNKTILTLIIIIFIGCSKESEPECNCSKEYYNIETVVVFDSNGLPSLQAVHKLQYTEVAPCQNDVAQQFTGDTQYFNVTCN